MSARSRHFPRSTGILGHNPVHGSVPEFVGAVHAALVDRGSVPGWGQPRDPSRPAGPGNPAQVGLGLEHPQWPWDPQVNLLIYKVCAENHDE